MPTATKKGDGKGEKARRRRNGRVEVESSRVESRGIKNVGGCTPRANERGPRRQSQKQRAEVWAWECNGRSGQAKQAIEQMISDAQADTRSLIGGLR
jgi:hypothetical protein